VAYGLANLELGIPMSPDSPLQRRESSARTRWWTPIQGEISGSTLARAGERQPALYHDLHHEEDLRLARLDASRTAPV
jgi:hypothetical protein